MPKFSKPILIGLVAVVAVMGVLLLVANLYLQSEGVQSRIRQAAGAALGSPVQTRSTFYTPWGGFVVGGIVVPDTEKPHLNLLEARELRIRVALLPLVQGRVVIGEVLLCEPVLLGWQREDRSWVMLVPPPPDRKIAVEIPATGETQRKGGASFQVEVQRVAVQGATVVLIDASGRTVLRAEKADGAAKVGMDGTSSGTFDIGKLNLGGALRPRRISGPFEWNGETLSLPSLTGSLAGGQLAGNYTLDTKPNPYFVANLAVRDAKIPKLIEEAGGHNDGATGTLEAKLTLEGEHGTPESLTGSAEVHLVEARFTPVDFLVQAGRLFDIDELQQLDLSDATAHATIRDGKVHINDILLRSENLMMTGSGEILFDGAMDIEASLLVNRHLQRQLRAVMSEHFVEAPDGYKKLDFSVGNTLASPRTDLLDKLVGARVGRDVGGLLRQLLGPRGRTPQPAQE